MNDIYTVSDKFSTILYADDTTLTSAFGSITECKNSSVILSDELGKIYYWLSANRLSLNLDKTKYMVFSNSKHKSTNLDMNIKILNHKIEQITTFNFLGLTINSNMNWDSHIEKISNKISRTVGILNKLKHFLPSSILLTIYNSLITPHLNFGVTAWGFSANKVFKLQKKAIRAVTHSKYNAHTSPLFKTLKILKVEDIFHKQCLVFYFKFCNGLLPEFFQSLYVTNQSIHPYNTRQSNSIHRPKVRTVSASKCIRHYLPILLQEMPNYITEKLYSHSLQGFSNYVKNYFLEKYNSECNIVNCYICCN